MDGNEGFTARHVTVKHSIGSRIATYIILSFLGVGAVLGVWSYTVVMEFSLRQAEARAGSLADEIGYAFETLLPHRDMFSVQRIVEQTSTLKDVRLVALVDREGKIIAHNEKRLVGEIFNDALAIETVKSGVRAISVRPSSIVVADPLHGPDYDLATRSDIVGAVWIELNLAAIQAELRRSYLLLATAAIIALLTLGTAVMIIIRRMVIFRLELVDKGLTQLETGRLDFRLGGVPTLEAQRGDEISRMATRFDRMAETLQKRSDDLTEANARLQEEIVGHIEAEAALRDLKEGLERTVAARTEEIAEARERLDRVLSAAGDGIYAIDTEGKCIFVNPACLRMLGYEQADELIGQKLHPLMHHAKPDGAPYPVSECRICQAFLTGLPVEEQHETFWRKDGGSFRVEYTSHPLFQNGKVRGAVVNFRDITERIETERALRYAQKIDSLGNLAGGVAHNMNNLLLPIISLTHMTLVEFPEGSSPRKRLEKVVEAATKAKGLIQQILDFSQRNTGSDRKVALDVKETIKEALSLVLISVPSSIDIVENIGAVGAKVLINRDQISTVIMNLVSNAVDAFEGNVGKLTISLSEETINARDAAVIPGLKVGPHVKLSIIDTGTGMDEETLARVFDPFFTTKQVGEGNGLGLSVVHGIVERAGGAITINSSPHVGTTVDVYLPAVFEDDHQA